MFFSLFSFSVFLSLITFFSVFPLVQFLGLSFNHHFTLCFPLVQFLILSYHWWHYLCSSPSLVSRSFFSFITLICVLPLVQFLSLSHQSLHCFVFFPFLVSESLLSFCTYFVFFFFCFSVLSFITLFYVLPFCIFSVFLLIHNIMCYELCSSLCSLSQSSHHSSHYFMFFPLFSFSVFLIIDHIILSSSHFSVSQSFSSLITLFYVLPLIHSLSISNHSSSYLVFLPSFSFSVIIQHIILCSFLFSASQFFQSLNTLFFVLPLV